MMHQLMLVLLMIAFAIAYSQVEPNDREASKLIGEMILIFNMNADLTSNIHSRSALLLCWRFLFCKSAD